MAALAAERQRMNGVSVIIPCFNARPWIGAALQSVFDQGQAVLEVIVVDDGSTDGSGQLVADMFPTVRLLQLENGGPSRARNAGLRVAEGQFIQFLDADDLILPGKLESQLRALRDDGADIAYGDWHELVSSTDGDTSRAARVVSQQIGADPVVAVLTDFWCPPAAYLFRRSIVDAVGGWDEQQMVVEDVRFVLECAMRGAHFRYCPGLAAAYRVHASNSQSTRDPRAFTRGCLRNAATVEAQWRRTSDFTPARVAGLVKAYAQVARASYDVDMETFDAAYAALERLSPGYMPVGPWHLSLTSRLVGYRSAEALALRYRQAKRTLKHAVRSIER